MKSLEMCPSGISGIGVFAAEEIKKGEIIVVMTGEVVDIDEMRLRRAAGEAKLMKGLKVDHPREIRPDDPFQIEERKFLLLDDILNHINHSCDPNGGIRKERELFALRDIHKGEEVTYDYSTIVGDHAIHWIMRCGCGSNICRHEIKNWTSLPSNRLKYYKERGAFPDWILVQMDKK